MEALSDGVIAIALTLLILNVVTRADKTTPGQSLASHLLHTWPTIGAYVLGFMSIVVCWVNHDRLFHYVTKVDSGLLLINAVQLLLISAVPLPTALLAANLTKPGQRTALIIYGVDAWLVALMFFVLWHYVVNRGLTDPSIDPDRYGGVGAMYVVGMLWTGLAVIAASINVFAALTMWALMFVAWAFPAEFSGFIQSRLNRPAASGEIG